MFLDFIYNISLLVACCVVYALLPHQWMTALAGKRPGAYQLLSGMLIGCLGIVVMSKALQFVPGVMFDTRSIILCVAGVICGPVTAAIAAALCAVYRLWMGGAGALVGVCVIAESAFMGSMYYHWRHRDQRLNGYLPLYVLGLLVHVIMLAFMLGMPGGIGPDVLRSITLPVLLLYPLGVVLLCRFFLELEARKISGDKLELSERNYRNLVEQAGSIILRWKPDGTITFLNEFAEKFFGYPRQELLGRNLLGTIIPERDSVGYDLTRFLSAVVADPELFAVNTNENIRRDGSSVMVNWTNRPIVDPAGNIIEFMSIGNDMSDHRRVEQQLARSDEQYRRIVETVNEGVWSVDSGFCTTFVNRQLCDMLGYAHEDMLGSRLDTFMQQEDMSGYAEGTSDCMGRQPGLFERRFVRKDGSILWALVSAMPIIDKDGSFAGSLATLTDISAQKLTVLKIQQSEAKFRGLFEHMTQGCFYQSADGTLNDINPAAVNMLGLSRDEFLERPSYSTGLNVVDDNESPLAPEEHPAMVALKTCRPVIGCVIGVFNQQVQDYVWMTVNALPQFHADEHVPYGVIVTLEDITENRRTQNNLVAREHQVRELLADAQHARKALLSIMEDDRHAHEALQLSEERYRTVVETATDAIITVDSAGMIVLWNRAATHIFGYDSSEIEGAPFAMLFAGALQDQDVRSLLSAFASRVLPTQMTVNEVMALKKNGTEFPIEIAFGIDTQDSAQYITAIVRDITDRKLIEQEALRSAQLVSIGELAAGVAHEINNPIMGVINYAQIMLNNNRAQGADIEIPVRIIKEGERIASIVSNLLNLARPVGSSFSSVTVQEIFEPASQLMQKLLKQSDVVLDVQFCENQPRVFVFPQKIQQVFINLISNALYALDLRFPGPHADKRLEVRVQDLSRTSGKFIRVVFLDHGCGIKAEDLARICNPFFTTKPMGKGTGLGLSICHKIIQEHGGRLLFESTPGEYTRVMVDLPTER